MKTEQEPKAQVEHVREDNVNGVCPGETALPLPFKSAPKKSSHLPLYYFLLLVQCILGNQGFIEFHPKQMFKQGIFCAWALGMVEVVPSQWPEQSCRGAHHSSMGLSLRPSCVCRMTCSVFFAVHIVDICSSQEWILLLFLLTF